MKPNLKTILSITNKASLSKARKNEAIYKVKISLITKEPHLFFIEEYTKTQSFHKTLSFDETLVYLKKNIGKAFKVARFQTPEKEFQFLSNKRGFTRILENSLEKKKSEKDKSVKTSDKSLKKTIEKSIEKSIDNFPETIFSHNKTKSYLLPEGKPVSFLVELGIMNKEGKVFDKKQKKFRQINRFLEFVNDILDDLCKEKKPSKKNPLSIIDFGCGKSYLTFALYHFIVIQKNIPAHIIGLDLRSDVIETCTKLSEKCDYSDLHFFNDSIENYLKAEKETKHRTPKEIDMVISLHACNTATDYALASAIEQNAKVILAVPCCQHELHTSLQKNPLSPENPYAPFSRFGIIREHFSALTTDLMRSLLLEKAGYKVQVLEFIDIEHTAKNILIRAVKKKANDKAKKSEDDKIIEENEDLAILQKTLGRKLRLEELLFEN